MTDLRFDIGSLHRAYAEGLDPADMVDALLSRAAAVDDPGIFIHCADKAALLAQIAGLGPFDPVAKPLWGIPCGIKDNIDVAGMPTTAACPAYAYHPAEDATVVALLKGAGAIVVGKTNLDQFATGLVGLRTPYPAPRNAVDPRLVPGGSSSGSAVAVAHGIVSFALGTDTAGSGRVPAGLNNIVGLKPTIGAISAAGVVPACRTLDCVSIFALTADDAWRVFSVAARPDVADPYSREIALSPLAGRPPVLTVGVPAAADRRFYGDEDMQAGFEAALAQLQSLGCRIVELPFAEFYAAADLLYEGAWVAERYAAIRDFMDAQEDAMHPVTRRIIGGARRLGAADAFKGLYALQSLKVKLAPVLAAVDLLCVPTAPTHYTVDQVLADPIVTNSRNGTYTNFVNLLDLCGIAVPTGARSDSLPMSVTLLAPAGRDALTAALARDLHSASGMPLGATGWPQPRSAAAGPDENNEETIALAVVGAHLSGMPLNRELQALGARFCRAARTAPAYRLYVLSDQTMAKPGLIRCGTGDGLSIEVEIWRLPPAAFGRLVATIPAPLSIGTLELEAGILCKGFLAEPAGLAGATDISAYGGWRRFLEQTHKKASTTVGNGPLLSAI